MDQKPATNSKGPPEAGQLRGRLQGLSLRKQVLVLAIWPFMEYALGSLVSFVDMAIAGRLGETPAINSQIMNAMSFGAYIGWLLFILPGAVATGTSALISRATGAGDEQMANRALAPSLFLGLLSGSVAGGVLYLFADQFIAYVGMKGFAAAQAKIYISILALSAPLTGLNAAINGALRGSGDTKTPFTVTLVVNLVNAGLSCLFALGPGPMGGHGIAGVAWGTVCAWGVGVSLSLWKISSDKQREKRVSRGYFGLRLQWRAMQVEAEMLRRILRVGFPSALEILGMWAINFTGLRYIEKLGVAAALGAHGLAVRLESFSYLPGFALGVAAQTLAGQYLGAQNKVAAAQAVREAWKLGAMFMSLAGLVFIFFPGFLVGLVNQDNPELRALATPILQFCGFVQPFFATCIVMKMSMRGAGASRLVMQSAFSSMIIFRLIGMYLVVEVWHGTLMHIWYMIALDILAQAVLFTFLHYRGKWMDAKV